MNMQASAYPSILSIPIPIIRRLYPGFKIHNIIHPSFMMSNGTTHKECSSSLCDKVTEVSVRRLYALYVR